MKPVQRLPLLLSLILLFAAVSSQGAESSPEVRWNNDDQPPSPGLEHRSFPSAAMGVEVGYNVHLPPGYAQGNRRYPVVYFLHGATGNENSDAAGFSGVVSRLVEENKIPPALVVFPNGGPRSGYRDDPASKSMVETAIAKELVPIIDRDFRTLANRESRVIVGFSMGGGGAVRFALKYPDLFSAAGSWAGAFSFRHESEHSLPLDYAVSAIAPLRGRVRLMLVVGTEDLTLASHAPFLQNLVEAKFPFEFELLNQVGHDPGAYYEHSGEKMLRFLTRTFRGN